MSLCWVIIACLGLFVLGQKPDDLPCVTWVPFNDTENVTGVANYFPAATNVWLSEWFSTAGSWGCEERGTVFPCFNVNTSTWGHHDYIAGEYLADYCRTNVDGVVTYGNTQYLPLLGPKWQTWKWVNATSGSPVPDNAIRFGPSVLARNQVHLVNQCSAVGFTGWAEGRENGTFGDVHFSLWQNPFSTDVFEVAVCEAYHPTTTSAPPTTTAVPTTPPPTPSPTLPPNTKPYVRFANTIPSPNSITATITQGSTSYTWSSYGFAMFSDWVEVFVQGVGTITLVDSASGAQLLSTQIPLTNGPLVVAVKDYWPPSQSSNVETIAASYVPGESGSGVRLFNLSPDTPTASMSSGGTTLATAIDYTLGSKWAYVPATTATFTVTNTATSAVIATNTFLPPPAPFVFTNFLVGLSNSTSVAFAARLVPLIDAPEQ